MALLRPQLMFFRSNATNPLLNSNVKLADREIEAQKDLPVWERLFDHKKYMEHDGPIKMTTGLAMLDVEPFPRLKLMKLYYITLEELRDIPDSYGYKFVLEELTKYRMEVVDNNKCIRTIEETIQYGMIEELIYQAHNELKFLQITKRMKPWDNIEDFEDLEFKEMATNLNPKNLFASAKETYKHDRHDKPGRPKTANVHQE